MLDHWLSLPLVSENKYKNCRQKESLNGHKKGEEMKYWGFREWF